MSKRFKTQDYFRYKKLGKRWRRPVGSQSKLRLKKGGSGMKVAVGYGTPGKPQPTLIRNEKDFEKDCTAGVVFAGALGSRKTSLLALKAKELGLTVMNMRKLKRASRLGAAIKKKASEKTKAKEKAKHEAKEKAKTETKGEHAEKAHDHHDGHAHSGKMGFHESVVSQVEQGKTKTYRIRDHCMKVGDKINFENSQTAEGFGEGTITNVEHKKVKEIDLKDPAHGATYDKIDQLIAAFKRHYPETEVTPETKVHIYTYTFRKK